MKGRQVPPKSGIKAIETHYNGYRFRSRLEARWAVFFDTLGLRWNYEVEGFDLGVAGRYLPDFWLPDTGWFIEIKGQFPIPQPDLMKVAALAEGTRLPVMCFSGNIGLEAKGMVFAYGADGQFYQDKATWGSCPVCSRPGVFCWWDNQPGVLFNCVDAECSRLKKRIKKDFPIGRSFAPIIAAYTAARSARFEFGENGR